MITVGHILESLYSLVPFSLQEDYDNSGLLCGDRNNPVTGILVAFDVNDDVLTEAVDTGCNVVVAHHPLIFKPMRSVTLDTPVGRLVSRALENRIAVIAVHTNIDNHFEGVNQELARHLGLENLRILQPLEGRLQKLVTFVPHSHVDVVRKALFEAGAGHIGRYDLCSYNLDGVGTFRANNETKPFVGRLNEVHYEPEMRVEVVFPSWIQSRLLESLLQAHPYEEVAYDIFPMKNALPNAGAGMIGLLPEPLSEIDFLEHVKQKLRVPFLRHTSLKGRSVRKVAVCGGSGSFLINIASKSGADAFVTGDIKYHDFFDAPASLLVLDAGHFETEQFTVQLLARYLNEKIPNFAVLISKVNTNPVNYC